MSIDDEMPPMPVPVPTPGGLIEPPPFPIHTGGATTGETTDATTGGDHTGMDRAGATHTGGANGMNHTGGTGKANSNAPITIVIDTREQTPFAFPASVPTVRGTLHTGDYSVAGHEDQFTIERKSLADLVHTIIHDRGRFERELERMRAFAFRRVIVTAPFADVARGNYAHSMANPKSVIASICAFEIRYNVPFVFAANKREAMCRVADWARFYVRECALHDHERMLADHAGEPTHPPVRVLTTPHPSIPPTRESCECEVIPPKFGGTIQFDTPPRATVARKCKRVPKSGKATGKAGGGTRKTKTRRTTTTTATTTII